MSKALDVRVGERVRAFGREAVVVRVRTFGRGEEPVASVRFVTDRLGLHLFGATELELVAEGGRA